MLCTVPGIPTRIKHGAACSSRQSGDHDSSLRWGLSRGRGPTVPCPSLPQPGTAPPRRWRGGAEAAQRDRLVPRRQPTARTLVRTCAHVRAECASCCLRASRPSNRRAPTSAEAAGRLCTSRGAVPHRSARPRPFGIRRLPVRASMLIWSTRLELRPHVSKRNRASPRLGAGFVAGSEE